ncbi:MAG: NERD domain-containing protein [Acidobacteriota bacterium]|nr:MAG: NERD domain-containing protein [Acidobacteriota bacterium]
MARLIPHVSIDEIENAGERDTARSLVEQLPEDAVVIHSYPWLDTSKRGTLSQGEADFVVILWTHGFLVLEVKGGEIGYAPESLEWYRIESSRRQTIKDPFKQASKSLHVIKDRIRAEAFPAEEDLPVGYGYAVVFPDCRYTGTLPPGAEKEVVLCTDDLRRMGTRILEILDSWSRGTRELSEVEARKMLDALQSTFNLVPVLSRQIDDEYDRLVRLTNEQANVLDMLDRHRRCLIEGVAGSGKTMLAMERARRFAAEGKRTLLVCYNITLAEWLADSVRADEDDLLDVRYFHGLCKEMCGEAEIEFEPGEDARAFYHETSAELLLEAINRLGPRYGAIVVDEGQDFQPSWWMPLEFLGSEAGETPFYVFYDPAQNLYVDELVMPELGEPYLLKKNCRNTRSIAVKCSSLRNVEIETHWAAPEGRPVTVRHCPDPESQRKVAARILKDYRKGGLLANQIAILSPYRHDNSHYSFFGVDRLDAFPLVDSADELQARNGVLFSTIKGFKGLEADAVILVDVPNPATDSYFTNNDLYVGASRAKHFLSILIRDDFLETDD